jgi:hypothetical protein
MAAPFSEGVGTQVPLSMRFSTVAGESGSPDTNRDPRGLVHVPQRSEYIVTLCLALPLNCAHLREFGTGVRIYYFSGIAAATDLYFSFQQHPGLFPARSNKVSYVCEIQPFLSLMACYRFPLFIHRYLKKHIHRTTMPHFFLARSVILRPTFITLPSNGKWNRNIWLHSNSAVVVGIIGLSEQNVPTESHLSDFGLSETRKQSIR